MRFLAPLVRLFATPPVYTDRRPWHVYRGVHEQALTVDPSKQWTGETPLVSFPEQYRWLQDSVVNAAFDWMAEAVVGPGFWISAAEPDPTQPAAVEVGKRGQAVIEEFMEEVQADTLLLSTTKNCVAFGNDFHKPITPQDLVQLEPVPLTSIFRIKRREAPDGRVHADWVEQRLGGTHRRIPAAEFHHYRWNPENNAAFGVGLLTKLAQSLDYTVKLKGAHETRTRPSLMDMRMQLQDDFRLAQHRRIPRDVWHIPGATVADKSELESDLQVMEADQDVTVRAPNLTVHELGRTGKIVQTDAMQETVMQDVQQGLQTPILRLYTTPGFTEASAKEATDMALRKITMLQRFLKRQFERFVITPVLRQAGFDDHDLDVANVRLMWGNPDPPTLEMHDVIALVTARPDAIKTHELRRHLAKTARIQLDDDWSQPQPTETPEQQQVTQLLGEIRETRREAKQRQTTFYELLKELVTTP